MISSTYNTYFAAPVNICQNGDDYLIDIGYSGKFVCNAAGYPVFYLYDQEFCSGTPDVYSVTASSWNCESNTRCGYGAVTYSDTFSCNNNFNSADRILQVVTDICFYSQVLSYCIF